MCALSQKQVQKLSAKLSPQQIQMIKLLELPAIQLEQRIRREVEENPVLDEEQQLSSDEEQDQEVSMDEYLEKEDIPAYKYYANNYSKDNDNKVMPLPDGKSFHEYLTEQLGYRNLPERDVEIAQYIIGSLDEDGYLRRGLDSLCDDLAFTAGIETTPEHLERILKVIQQFEPVGVGARDLQECLLLQLRGKEERSESLDLATDIIANHYDDFVRKHYPRLMENLSLTEDDLRSAIGEIIKLHPKPANMYDGDSSGASQQVTPDFLLDVRGDGEFVLTLNSSFVPDLKISRNYQELLRSMAGRKQTPEERQTLMFVKQKIDSAKWFISAVKQRQNTLMSTMQAILDYQREYFSEGDARKLRPMILKDIAAVTGLDVSTISRVVSSKYIQTHFGIFPLKHFFSEAMTTVSGQEVSAHQIWETIQEAVDSEDKHNPLTDEQLMDILNAKGYNIARRTVSKYREVLGIPVARLRITL